MLVDYLTVAEIAEKWNLKERTIQTMCGDGRIEGAVKFGRDWAIPENAERPTDKRVKSGRYVGYRKGIGMKDTRYKYRIEKKDGGFVFVLYPNNSNTQAIGRSAEVYSDENQCIDALNIFRDTIRGVQVDQVLRFEKISDTEWAPRLEEAGKAMFVRDLYLAHGEFECKKWAEEVIDNIDARIKK